MKTHRSEMLSQNFMYTICKSLVLNIDKVEHYNNKNGTNIDINKIQITKIIGNQNAKAYKVFYISDGNRFMYQIFISFISKYLIRSLHKHNKVKNFPRIKFCYDSNYDKEMKLRNIC